MTSTRGIRLGSVIAVLDEARLRGINLDKLQHELFTDPAHIRMITEHELRAKWYRIRAAEVARPAKVKKTKAKSQDMVETERKYLFNPDQVRIAQAIFRKEKSNE